MKQKSLGFFFLIKIQCQKCSKQNLYSKGEADMNRHVETNKKRLCWKTANPWDCVAQDLVTTEMLRKNLEERGTRGAPR